MPTYQYRCTACDNDFEVFQSIKDDPVEVCSKCGAPVKKVYNAAGIIFKGSGFYVNDYKKNVPAESGTAADSGASSVQGSTAAAE